jgi:hypothetical protein
VLTNHSDRTFADLRRKLVRHLAHGSSTVSHIGASGKPATLQTEGVSASAGHLSWMMAPRPTRLNWRRGRYINPADSRYDYGTDGGQSLCVSPSETSNG